MEPNEQKTEVQTQAPVISPAYPHLQLAKAFTSALTNPDASTRERAKAKVGKWISVLENMHKRSAVHGSRTPREGVPAWATLEVVTGGFETGGLLAAGVLQPHEMELARRLPGVAKGGERFALNRYYLSEVGQTELRDRLQSGFFEVEVPEEGALLVVAWLCQEKHIDEMHGLLDVISPWFGKLRFYPIPSDQRQLGGSHVHLEEVGTTLKAIQAIKPNAKILAQRESVEVWAPYHDRVVGMFYETVVDGRPCQTYPNSWSKRAIALSCEYSELLKIHKYCRKHAKGKSHAFQLRRYLEKAAREPQNMTEKDSAQVGLILRGYTEKRGLPGSEECVEARARQRGDVSAPLHQEFAKVVTSRLRKHPAQEGLSDLEPIQKHVDAEESRIFSIEKDLEIPKSLRRRLERYLEDTVAVLVERGFITSGETLAKFLPQMTSGLRAAGIADPSLLQLYALIYRAFRRRRSLLLLYLQKQVQIEELPWVTAIDRFRDDKLSARQFATQALEEVSLLTIRSFPYAILPNKLLQELRAGKDSGTGYSGHRRSCNGYLHGSFLCEIRGGGETCL